MTSVQQTLTIATEPNCSKESHLFQVNIIIFWLLSCFLRWAFLCPLCLFVLLLLFFPVVCLVMLWKPYLQLEPSLMMAGNSSWRCTSLQFLKQRKAKWLKPWPAQKMPESWSGMKEPKLQVIKSYRKSALPFFYCWKKFWLLKKIHPNVLHRLPYTWRTWYFSFKNNLCNRAAQKTKLWIYIKRKEFNLKALQYW